MLFYSALQPQSLFSLVEVDTSADPESFAREGPTLTFFFLFFFLFVCFFVVFFFWGGGVDVFFFCVFFWGGEVDEGREGREDPNSTKGDASSVRHRNAIFNGVSLAG